MKKLFLAVLFMLPTVVFAADSYDPATGRVHIPLVSAGTDYYQVDMAHQGDLVFKVISVTPTSRLC